MLIYSEFMSHSTWLITGLFWNKLDRPTWLRGVSMISQRGAPTLEGRQPTVWHFPKLHENEEIRAGEYA